MKLNKKLLSYISAGLMALGLLLWLFAAAAKCTAEAYGIEASENYNGLKVLFGIKEEGETFTGLNFVALLGVAVAVLGALLVIKNPGDKKAAAIVVLGAVLLFASAFLMKLGYTKEMKEALKLAAQFGVEDPYKWAPAFGGYAALVLGLGSAGVCLYSNKVDAE